MGHLCYACLVFVMLLCLFLWSSAEKGQTSRLSFGMFFCVSVTFSLLTMGQWVLDCIDS